MSVKSHRLAPAVATPELPPAFDPADYLHPPRDGWNPWVVEAAAILHTRAHGTTPGVPARRLAADWLAEHDPAPF